MPIVLLTPSVKSANRASRLPPKAPSPADLVAGLNTSHIPRLAPYEGGKWVLPVGPDGGRSRAFTSLGQLRIGTLNRVTAALAGSEYGRSSRARLWRFSCSTYGNSRAKTLQLVPGYWPNVGKEPWALS